jgi:predicted Fe-Mo cluster-binding NifX family protein
MSGRVEGFTYIALSAVVATGASQPFQPGNSACSMQVKGITTATVQMQASNNGVDYVAVGELTSGASGVAGLTADGMLTLDRPYKYVRANVTAWTSGTITVTFFA